MRLLHGMVWEANHLSRITADNRAGKVQEVAKMTYDSYSPNSVRRVINRVPFILLYSVSGRSGTSG